MPGTLVVQSDGYEAYKSFGTANEQRKRASCLAHIRRKFEESLKARPQIAKWFLKIIGQLYQTEQSLRVHGASAEVRARVRQNRSRPLIVLLEKAVKHLREEGRIYSKTNLGKALTYATGQLPAMHIYLEHGEVEIDNNLVENAIRPTAIGKKNHLFIGSPDAGQKSALLYSLLLVQRL